jgi:putative endonuclease
MSSYVYIITNRSKTLYVGVINQFERRLLEHSMKMNPYFTSKCNISFLVYYEVYEDIHQAIKREKEIKGWRREKKIRLIESMNPDWEELSRGWF